MTDTPYVLRLTASEVAELSDLVEDEAFEREVGPYERDDVHDHTVLLNAILEKLQAPRAQEGAL